MSGIDDLISYHKDRYLSAKAAYLHAKQTAFALRRGEDYYSHEKAILDVWEKRYRTLQELATSAV